MKVLTYDGYAVLLEGSFAIGVVIIATDGNGVILLGNVGFFDVNDVGLGFDT